jgi:hypothetical protein
VHQVRTAKIRDRMHPIRPMNLMKTGTTDLHRVLKTAEIRRLNLMHPMHPITRRGWRERGMLLRDLGPASPTTPVCSRTKGGPMPR